MKASRLYIGTAGSSIPRAFADRFPGEGTHLERYAAVFRAAEINSSFHRPHRAELYAKWAAAVPAEFRFAVKMPKTITHEARLLQAGALLEEFCGQVAGLGNKLGCLLVQLPPSFEFESKLAAEFFKALRALSSVDVACEPRHPSWFGSAADSVLKKFKVARVAADPARVPDAALCGGWGELCYHRLHGSPRMYYSAYSEKFLKTLAATIKAQLEGSAKNVWCIFDNTTLGEATGNALSLQELLPRTAGVPPASF